MEFKKKLVYLIVVALLLLIVFLFFSNREVTVKENQKGSSSLSGEVLVTVLPGNNAAGKVLVDVYNKEVSQIENEKR